MKESDSSAGHETQKKEEELLLKEPQGSEIKQEASQELDCDNNCLSGIKWPPEHQAKNEPRRRGVLNGFRKVKAGIVTHGGRTSKLPARFLETDSESESTLNRKRIRSKKDDQETSGERSSTCKSTSKRKICKNGRTEPLKKNAQKVIKRSGRSKSCCEVDMDANVEENGDSRQDATQPTKAFLRSSPSRTLPENLKRNCYTSHSDTESSGGETPRKRGRPPKNAVDTTSSARGKSNGSLYDASSSPHGDCFMSATNACLTSPNVKPKKKKRKLLNGLRAASFLQGVSSDESSSECSPKKRGRPPKPKHPSLSKSDSNFSSDHTTKNGVRKPWVRPLLKSLHKRALYQSHEEHLGNLLSSSEKHLTKVKAKFAKMNAKCTNGELVKPKRGRPSKLDLLKKQQLQSKDVFSFTDEEDCLEKGKFNGHLKKLKKLKKSNQLTKRPLGATRVNKSEKLLASKLKKKAMKRAARTGHGTENVESSDTVSKDSSEALHSRRRHRNRIDRVLGMRLNSARNYEYLVQWKDGTSCWTSSDQAAVDYELDLKAFLGHECQGLCGINRLVFKAYYHDNLDKVHCSLLRSETEGVFTSENESICDDDDDDELFSDADDIFDKNHTVPPSVVVTPKKRGRKPQECNIDREFVCKEVSVQKLKDCVHITVSRSSGKQMRVNLRIIDSLTLALEEAAVDQSDTVVISGFGDDVFCGVDLETIMTIPLEGEVKNYRKDIDKIRYLIQTIQYYPKPIIATINKPAEGVGAQLIALCDMVCDKAALGDPVNLAVAKANGTIPYCFPRLMGHSTVSEHVLMGQPLSAPVMDWQNSLSEVFKSAKFTSELLTSVEAMSRIPPCSQSASVCGERLGACTSKEEQKLCKEVEMEKAKVQDSLKELMEFWGDVTAKMS
ncbi:hypothetical protein QZH41_009359 [Actinostola sp. cb2023]|nr:hypothetical protein QZH41_009359 [Actinostola sp. cb2023]